MPEATPTTISEPCISATDARKGEGALRRKLWPATGIAIAALLLFTNRISATELNNDEYCTWWAIHLSLPDLWHLLQHVDAVLAPYYLLLKGWCALFGDSEASLRTPSVLAMAVAGALITRVGQKISDTETGLFAAIIFLTLPMAARLSILARPYAFATGLAVASTWLLLRAMDRPTSRMRLSAYAISLFFLGAMHLVAIATLCGHLVLVLGQKPQQSAITHKKWLGRWALASVLGLVPLVPIVLIGATQSAQLRAIDISEVTVKGLAASIFGLTLISRIIFVLSAIALLRKVKAKWALLTWALVPPIALYCTYEYLHIFRARYLFFTVPAWVLLAALGVSKLKLRDVYRRLLYLALCVTLAVPGGKAIYRWHTNNAKALSHRLIGEVLTAMSKPEDVILYGGSFGDRYHLRIGVAYAMRQSIELRDVLVRRTAKFSGKFHAQECSPLNRCFPNKVDRAWVLTAKQTGNILSDLGSERAALVQHDFRLARTWSFGKYLVGLLVREPNSDPISHPGEGSR